MRKLEFCLEVSGEFACFTRPEMKVERVSYDVITPSAARAIFEAILWKPAIRWHIRRIEVLNPLRWINVRLNEVGGVIPTGAVGTAMKRQFGHLALYVEDDRQQRAGLFLRDVRYRLHAELEVRDHSIGNEATKFAIMFERRVEKGQCFNQPYFGMREFACDFRLMDDNSTWPIHPELQGERNLDWMLYDLDFENIEQPMPRFYQARMRDGVIVVPPWDSKEIRG